MRPHLFCLLTLLGLAPCATTAAETNAGAPLLPAVEKAAATLPAGGFVLGEITAGSATFASAGRASPRAGIAPEKIIFEIGSITKVFTALLLAETVGEGKAALTDPIRRHLPRELELTPEVAGLTLAQLATHTSGLPSLPSNFTPADRADPYADYTVDQLYSFLRDYRPKSPTPQPAAYSNLGFGLLGHLLERIHGRSYGELVAARITGPLGMRDTVIVLNAEQQSRFATPHSGSDAVRPWRLDTLAGAGALRSTAADLALFAQAMLGDRDAALTRAWKLATEPRAPFGGPSTQIGLAILMARRGDDLVFNHSGGTGGFRTYLEIVPSRGTATVLLLNNDVLEPASVVMAVRRPPAPAGIDLKARPEEPIDAAQLKAYPGVYAIDARGRFTVVLDETGRLRARLTGQGFLPLYHAGKDRFFARAVAAEFQFKRNAAGDVEALTLHQNGNEIPARRDPAAPPAIRFLSPAQLRDYVGRYQLAPEMVFELTLRNDTLLAKLTGQPALPVFCDAPDHFVYDVVDAALTFTRGTDGQVTSLTLHQNGHDAPAPRLPIPPPAKP